MAESGAVSMPSGLECMPRSRAAISLGREAVFNASSKPVQGIRIEMKAAKPATLRIDTFSRPSVILPPRRCGNQGFWGQVHCRAPICCAGSAINGAMPFHLIKLAVGAESLAD
ncbi:MAG TPA: hypothetical protein VIJ63_09590 [Roseiarcus sp.]